MFGILSRHDDQKRLHPTKVLLMVGADSASYDGRRLLLRPLRDNWLVFNAFRRGGIGSVVISTAALVSLVRWSWGT